MTIDTDILRHSVTRGDYTDDPRSRAPMLLFVHPTPYGAVAYSGLQPYWSRARDYQLRGTIYQESLWADAIYKAITRIAALGWTIEDTERSPGRIKRSQALYLRADFGQGWVKFISKHLRDYLLTDNGAFVEIIRATAGVGSRILGLTHLDSCRCTRTDDPSRPVLYRDRNGAEHVLKAHQVLTFADMPDAGEAYNGVGFCSASRAWHRIAKMAAMEQYGHEKVTGDGATELTFLRGVKPQALEDAIRTTDEEQKRRGVVYYKGKMLVPVLDDMDIQEVTIPLKTVGDGFDVEKERDYSAIVYANAIGIPVQALKPLSGQGLGTGTQTVILDDAAEGEGLSAWLSDWKQTNNEKVLPTATTFAWSNRHDTRDRKAKADADKAEADVVVALLGTPTAPGVVTQDQALNMAVDKNLVPREFLPTDATAGTQLADDEKPVDVQAQIDQAVPPA